MRILLAAVPVLVGLLLPSVSLADLPQFPFVHAEGEAELETIEFRKAVNVIFKLQEQ